MNMVAAGAYLRALRKAAGLTQEELAVAVGVAGNTIYRIEKGRQEPKTAQIVSLLAILKGRAQDLADLLANHSAKKEDGERLAAEARAMTDEELERTIQVLETLRDNPKALEQWIKIGKTLADE